MTPSYSIYTDMSEPVKIYNVYRSRLLGQMMQNMGMNVIPIVYWADERSFDYCFDGLPENATLSTYTVGIKDPEVWKIWKAADRRFEYYVPCPHCGHLQTFKFKNGIKWDENAKTAEERKESAYYECEHCRQRITDQHKQQMLRSGIWKDIETGEQ